ncbi:ParB family protein [Microbacterium stercoris]|uniref:Centromere-binding protein ParB C-terminal domain-containing protein n=1 Tax=Microbacterium stercoris TaxID=2820289 RepID=A0A939QKZ6_9MICO|nr:hypothetical protein [Microbacterium stercoris]MBO3662710.1 hypothetical protein [Microbacterium stercoris]
MSRPAPRRSSLAGSSPVTPPQAKQASTQPVDDEPVDAAPVVEPVAAPTSRPRSSSTSTTKAGTKKAYPPKVSFYQDREDTDRVRGAILHTMATEGYRGLSQFIHLAVMEKVEQLEKKYNGGKPFPAVSARELPQGRPMGE